jgi:anti-sigma B factor antagonist
MIISERAVGNVRVVDVEGAITQGPSDLLTDKIRSLLQQGEKRLVVNLAAVPYMDSAGLGALVQAYATTAKQGGSLKLQHLTTKIHDLLVITKLITVFECFDDEPTAVASFAQLV